jgi:Uma2 family endonuclease
MNIPTQFPTPDEVVYPDSDGKPMADNTFQFEYIVVIKCGLDAQYCDDPNVFIAGDLLWYPVQGNNKLCQAPDTMAVIGRPKGYRGSYKQWVEDGIAPQVAFEIRSPNNSNAEMKAKFEFYQKYGVQEYYLYDPDEGTLQGWVRQQGELVDVIVMQGWVSPLLGIKFQLVGKELELHHPDGSRFETFVELARQQKQALLRAEQERQRAEHERELAEQERQRADRQQQRADQQQQRADQQQQRAEQEQRRADEADARAARLRAMLEAHGIDPGAEDSEPKP